MKNLNTMKRLFMMSLLAVSTVLSAQQSTELKLWPNGAPNTNGITTDEQEPEKNRISNVTAVSYTHLTLPTILLV